MHVLFADAVAEDTIEALERHGHSCRVEPGLGASELADHVGGVDVLVVRSTKVRAEVFENADRLALVVRAGAGVNTIDTASAARRGVLVSNVPGRNAAAVAELTMGLILAVDRRIPDNVADLRAGRWEKKKFAAADGLAGRTIGIVGLGSIGIGVAQRAAGFDMVVQTLSRPGRDPAIAERAAALGVRTRDSLAELAASSDVLTLHVPATAATTRLVDADVLARMRPGAILVNTSRADIVDEHALVAALDAGTIRAALDVWPDEPSIGSADWSTRLSQHPAVVGTHHIGASTEQAQAAIAEGVVEVIEAFAAGEARNCVNLSPARLGSVTLTVRHLDRVGVLARVLDVLSVAGLNVEHMQNRIFRGGEAAVASIDVAGPIPDGVAEEVAGVEHVLGVATASLPANTQLGSA